MQIDDDETPLDQDEIDYRDSLAVNASLSQTPQRPRAVHESTDPSTPGEAARPQPAPRKKITITHDKFLSIQSMILLHLTTHEQKTESGLEREALIDWYLEQKEAELSTPEELEAEQDLISKVLKRLVKVRRWGNHNNTNSDYFSGCRTTIC